ncbi:putative MbtH-like protein [Actinoplanes missouriensis 431]|uniref:Putative MbtH-like protein n=1 Tax=Actinoplanes missouriensis (strain ATCC 14538 / DSM 43046 / CBS 188.64 / JCM 3121 / NBRC 102363 / NCIMB 12654 / NRRL B-3342 / UNCC 431) TaxID=512565 RepID=I0HB02_ACTM4|nr:MbtH family NRPS accessory protein [Actinoplanes missouriensis]BAL90189.1 putative MbtH-like protein [Actinoplanes missouriensis 431]
MSDDNRYRVVSNHEDQHSLWFVDRELPAGWADTGFTGSKDACLAHIAEVWTDLTPRSVRDHSEAAPV